MAQANLSVRIDENDKKVSKFFVIEIRNECICCNKYVYKDSIKGTQITI